MTITINNKSEINAKGNLSNGKCKPTLCINNGEVYTSGMDAAKAYNIYPADVSKICCGKKKSIKATQKQKHGRISSWKIQTYALI